MRDRQEPIRLFGETDEESLQRLKRLEVEMPDINKGYKNDFMAAMNSVDKEYNESILRCFNDEEADKKAIKTADVDVRKEADNWDSIQVAKKILYCTNIHLFLFSRLILKNLVEVIPNLIVNLYCVILNLFCGNGVVSLMIDVQKKKFLIKEK